VELESGVAAAVEVMVSGEAGEVVSGEFGEEDGEVAP
jgi:hypothetical protein